MASSFDMNKTALGFACALVTGVLYWFGTGLFPLWPLMWFAPLPVLYYALCNSWQSAALVAGGGWLLGNLNLWYYFQAVLEMPRSQILRQALPDIIGVALAFTLAALLFRLLVRRRSYWAALLAVPSLWVSCEFLFDRVSIHGTGGNLAYSQLSFLPFLQLASLTGPWGMSFLLLLLPSALALGIHLYGAERKQASRLMGAAMGLLIAVLAFGTARLSLPMHGSQVKVGLIASDGANEDVADEGEATAKLFQAYAQPVTKLAAEGAEVVVLPEKLGVAVDPDTQTVDAQLQALANQAHVSVVAGMIRVVPPSARNPVKIGYNEARIYTPGAPVQSYDKEHMLPPFESNLTPGTTLTLLPAGRRDATWGVAICKDMDFTPLGRRYGKTGAGLMLVPGWDFFRDWIQHGHMAIMRGVESGFSVVRAAKGGSLFVSDDRGRILAEVKSDSAPFATLLAEVPDTHDNTLYLMLGDWFGWVNLGLLALILASLVFKRR